MRVRVYPGVPRGCVRPPCSKSAAHRAFFCALGAEGESRIGGLDMSEDIAATIDVISALGGGVQLLGDTAVVRGERPRGQKVEIDCRQSASTLRFAIPMALARGQDVTFTGQGRLMQRPLETYQSLCRRYGFGFDLSVGRLRVNGAMTSGNYRLEGLSSSQFVSGMMMALGSLEGSSEIVFGVSPSTPYINLTGGIMSAFGAEPRFGSGGVIVGGGYKKTDITVEADWSQGAVWACLGAVCGDITCLGLDMDSLQGDRSIAPRLAAMDACVDGLRFAAGSLEAADFDCTDHPDLAPVAAACGCFSRGRTRLLNTSRLTVKESDRAAAIVGLINQMGGRCEDMGDAITVYPQRPKGDVTVDCGGDHRIAMMAAVLACGAEKPTVINQAESVGKSYPMFWRHLQSLGIRVDIDEE